MNIKKREECITELIDAFHLLKRTIATCSAPSLLLQKITHAQMGVLIHLQNQGNSTVKEIAASLGITSSAATQLITGLVESGHVTRREDAGDRRSSIVALSTKSKKMVEKMEESVIRALSGMFDSLTDTELSQYLLLTKKVATSSVATIRASGRT